LGRTHLLELASLGIGIGSHGAGHLNWTLLDERELAEELGGSKKTLEDLLGRTVDSAAIPFGQYNRPVLRALKRYDFDYVYSSDGGPRISSARPIPRFSVHRGTTPEFLREFISRATRPHNRLVAEFRALAKAGRMGPVGMGHG
jgi:peptidoglycan/xylan/chitin deacetylase (PgdA/CDA1 family)